MKTLILQIIGGTLWYGFFIGGALAGFVLAIMAREYAIAVPCFLLVLIAVVFCFNGGLIPNDTS